MKRAWPVPLVVLGLAALLACSRSTYRPTAIQGSVIFIEACRACHAGPFSPGKSLAGRNLNAAAVRRRLRFGGNGMPAFPGIKGEARRNLVSYVVDMSRQKSGGER